MPVTIIHILSYVTLTILHFAQWISCCLHADQIMPNLPLPQKNTKHASCVDTTVDVPFHYLLRTSCTSVGITYHATQTSLHTWNAVIYVRHTGYIPKISSKQKLCASKSLSTTSRKLREYLHTVKPDRCSIQHEVRIHNAPSITTAY